MNILFCSDTIKHNVPHSMWENEVKIASKLTDVFLLDESAFQEGRFETALRKLPKVSEEKEILYRGWMRDKTTYQMMYDILLHRGYRMLNNAQAYESCHMFPGWYQSIRQFTPASRIVEGRYPANMKNEILDMLRERKAPLIIKDYVSSLKHNWNDACFIPKDSSEEFVDRVVHRFLDLKDDYGTFVGGLIIREFVELESLGLHPKSGMPLSKEFRTFVLRGKPVYSTHYWEEASYPDLEFPKKMLDHVAGLVYKATGNNFFTIDTAALKAGGFTIIEVGDGQVSSLPDNADIKSFYQEIVK